MKLLTFFLTAVAFSPLALAQTNSAPATPAPAAAKPHVVPAQTDPFSDPFIKAIEARHQKAVNGDTAETKSLTTDLEKWTKEQPNNHLLQAYLGSVYTLDSRDAWPGPGKLTYLKNGGKELDAAVGAEPDNPAVRFIRAIDYYELPTFFGKRQTARDDFAILVKQVEGVIQKKDHDENKRRDDQRVADLLGAGVGGDVEDLRRDGGVEIQDERGAEIGEGADEDEARAGKKSGPGQRQRDGDEATPRRGAEIGGGLKERGIDVGEGRANAEKKDREEMQHLQNDDAGEAARTEPVDGMGEGNNSELGEKKIERTEPGEDVFDAESADEGRQDERGEQRGPEEFTARKTAAGEKNRERNGDEGGAEGREDGDFKAVDEGGAVEAVLDEEAEEIEREGLVPVRVGEEERAIEEPEQRVDEEEAEKEGEEEEEKIFHRAGGEQAGGEVGSGFF